MVGNLPICSVIFESKTVWNNIIIILSHNLHKHLYRRYVLNIAKIRNSRKTGGYSHYI